MIDITGGILPVILLICICLERRGREPKAPYHLGWKDLKKINIGVDKTFILLYNILNKTKRRYKNGKNKNEKMVGK